jgi:hypothetical protein
MMRIVDYFRATSNPRPEGDFSDLCQTLKEVSKGLDGPIQICHPNPDVECKSCGIHYRAQGTGYYALHGIITKGANGGIVGSGRTFKDGVLQEVHIYCPSCLIKILMEARGY